MELICNKSNVPQQCGSSPAQWSFLCFSCGVGCSALKGLRPCPKRPGPPALAFQALGDQATSFFLLSALCSGRGLVLCAGVTSSVQF